MRASRLVFGEGSAVLTKRGCEGKVMVGFQYAKFEAPVRFKMSSWTCR